MNENNLKETLNEARVLVLDDEKEVRDLVSGALQVYGTTVETAADGREGLQILIDHDFDVLVVDLRMRHMDGITFLQEALRIWPWLGVVVITGYGGAESIRKIQKLGVTRVVEKPFGRKDLLENVAEEYISKKEQVERQEMISLAKIQQQLQILRVITEPALSSERLIDALRNLTDELGKFLDFAVVGVLGIEQDEHALILNIREEVSPEFISNLKSYISRRYSALIDKQMPEEIRIEMKGVEPTECGARNLGETFCVPIMSEGEVKGLLTLSSPKGTDYDASDVSFIYHVANHLSTVFSALSRMRKLAIHDSMTGLYNRLHLEAELRDVWAWSERYKRPIAIVIMDLDHFKAVNDTYGHLVGDEVLKEFAQLLKKTGRSSDIIGRYGGEEFIVILQETEAEEAMTYTERVLNETRKHVFCEGEQNMHLTVSIGVSFATADKGGKTGPQDILLEADQAMYAAKRAGRNCVRTWAASGKMEDSKEGRKDTADTKRVVQGKALTHGKVIVVDDDDAVRHLVTMMLKKKAYDVDSFSSGQEALQEIEKAHGEYDLLIADVKMPHIDGFELVNRVKAFDETIICIMISGHATADNAIESLRRGAYDFLQKPFVYSQVIATVNRAMDYRRTLLENRQYQRHLSEMVRQKSASAREALCEVEKSYEFTLEALVGLLDAREKDTGDHSKRVRAMAVRLGKEMGIDEDGLVDISYGALLHDIGKIGIPDRVLLKPGRLTPEEQQIMQKHPEIGYRVVAGSTYLQNAAEIVYSHQERYDGGGYPRGLRNGEICVGARIFAVIDAYDAMRSDRVYRDALPENVVVKEIISKGGTQFDPEVARAFERCHEDLNRIYCAWEHGGSDGSRKGAGNEITAKD